MINSDLPFDEAGSPDQWAYSDQHYDQPALISISSLRDKSETNKSNKTTRYLQLLFNTGSGTVAATEVEQEQAKDLWADITEGEDWHFYNGRSATREKREKTNVGDDIFIYVSSSSASSDSLSTCSSLSDDDDSDEDEDDDSDSLEEMWQDFVKEMVFDVAHNSTFNFADFPPQEKDTIPFIFSTVPLADSFDPFGEGEEPIGAYLLSSDFDNNDYGSHYVHVKQNGFHPTKLYSIRWRELVQKIVKMLTIDKDDAERILLHILGKEQRTSNTYACL